MNRNSVLSVIRAGMERNAAELAVPARRLDIKVRRGKFGNDMEKKWFWEKVGVTVLLRGASPFR